MTERLREEQLDDAIRSFLGWKAGDVANAPSQAEMAVRINSGIGARRVPRRVTPHLVWIVLASLVLAGLGTALVFTIGRDRAISEATLGPPTNGWIAYSTRAHSATSGVTGEIVVVREGDEPRIVAGGDELITICPRFSPDGARLAYVSGGDLVVLEGDPAKALREVRRFKVADRIEGTCPAWSPSATTIGLLIPDGIRLLDLDGGSITVRLPESDPVEFADTPLAWAPDGASIAAARTTGIWLSPTDGSAPRRLSTKQVQSMSWSQDGTRLVVDEYAVGAERVTSVLDVGGDRADVFLGSGGLPDWSPSGEFIAFDLREITIVRPDGSDSRLVGVGGAYGFGGWSPDGRSLLRMIDVSGRSWDLVVIGESDGVQTFRVRNIPTGSSRNFPNMADISWQALVRH